MTCLGRVARAASAMRWRRVVFGHWPVRDPVPLLERLPSGVTLDAFGDDAWMSVVALELGGPGPLPTYRQVNVRTYVHGPCGPGLFIYEARVDRPRALGPKLLGLPYRLDPRVGVSVRDGEVEVRRADEVLRGRVIGERPARARKASLDEFLVERYWTYARLPLAGLCAVRVAHAPWELTPAELMSPALGPAGRAHVSPGVDVVTAEVVRLNVEARPALEHRREPARI